jgi:hypothetical protein
LTLTILCKSFPPLGSDIPPLPIAIIGSIAFYGIVADEFDCSIELKAFNTEIHNNYAALKKEEENYRPNNQ